MVRSEGQVDESVDGYLHLFLEGNGMGRWKEL